MNEEIKKLKLKIRNIDEKINESAVVQANVADDKSKTVTVTVPFQEGAKMRGSRNSGGATRSTRVVIEPLSDAETGETFDLDFSKIKLSDDDIRGIIEDASDKPAKTRGGATKSPAKTREIINLGLEKSPAPRIVLTRTDTENGEMWQVVEKCEYKTDNGGVTITVPKGFITDLASVPRIFWGIVASFELSLSGPLFHDLIYRCAGQIPAELVNPDHIFERDETDALFLELMVKSGVPHWKCRVAYRAVRTFARFAWKNIGVITKA